MPSCMRIRLKMFLWLNLQALLVLTSLNMYVSSIRLDMGWNKHLGPGFRSLAPIAWVEFFYISRWFLSFHLHSTKSMHLFFDLGWWHCYHWIQHCSHTHFDLYVGCLFSSQGLRSSPLLPQSWGSSTSHGFVALPTEVYLWSFEKDQYDSMQARTDSQGHYRLFLCSWECSLWRSNTVS